MAKEAKKMCDWMKRENKLLTFSLSEPCELEECRLIRIKALHAMTRLLHDSTFPSSKVSAKSNMPWGAMMDEQHMSCFLLPLYQNIKRFCSSN
jgi:hypothetical protein